MGTSQGEVKCLLQPYANKGITRALSHKVNVTKLVSTQDSRFLFSAGEDGTLFIYQVMAEKVYETLEITS